MTSSVGEIDDLKIGNKQTKERARDQKIVITLETNKVVVDQLEIPITIRSNLNKREMEKPELRKEKGAGVQQKSAKRKLEQQQEESRNKRPRTDVVLSGHNRVTQTHDKIWKNWGVEDIKELISKLQSR